MSCPKWALAPVIVVAATGVAVLCRLGFYWFVGPAPVFLIPFVFPVVVAGLYGGTRWGLFATALNAALVAYFFTPPQYRFTIRDFDDRMRVGMFLALGVILSGLTGSLRRYRKQTEEYARTLEREVAGRREIERILEQRVRERTSVIEAQNSLLDAVLDALPVAAIIADPTGKFIRINRASYDICGAVPLTSGVEDYPVWVGYWPDTGRRLEPMEWPLSRAVFGGESCIERIEIERFGDSGRRTLQVSAAPVRGPDGTVIAGVVTAIDLTDREGAERALKESERRFQTFMNHAPFAAWITDADSRGVYTSLGFDQHLGLATGSFVGKIPADIWPAEIAGEYVENNRRVLAGGATVETEEPFVRPDGSAGVAHVVKFPMSGPLGEPLIGGVAIDITNGKRSEEALRASEERFRNAFDHAPIGVSLTATDGRWLRVNRSLCELTGYTEDELLASDFQSITHPDDLGNDLAHVKGFINGNVLSYQTEKRYVHKLGHLVYVHVSVSMVSEGVGKPPYFICHINDITPRKEHERALAANAVLLRQCIKHSPAAIAMFDRDMRYVQVSDRWLADYQLGDREIIGQCHYDVFPDIPDHWKVVHQRVLAGAVERCDQDPFYQADGSTDWLQWECQPWHDAAGKVAGLIMFTQVITERKQADEVLRLSEERYRALVAALAEGVVLQDEDGAIIASNQRASEILGLTEDQIAGRTSLDPRWAAIQEDGSPFHGTEHPSMVALRTGQPVYDVVMGVRRPTGELTWMVVNAVPFGLSRSRPTVVASFHDITRIRKLVEQVQASLREKDVMVKEIHHRVKNNLQIVSALLHLQSASLPDPEVRQLFEETRGRVKSMALIHERLYRSRDLAGVDLGEYVRELAADVCRAYQVSQESVHLELSVSVPPLPLDVAIPCGLILNELISNCLKHAFKGRATGRIGVTFRRIADGNVVLSVSDDGAGFPPGLNFRTSASFGLQLIHTLADQLHGQADLSTGNGTTVAVTFPAPREALQ